jgi:hypothetical protein
LDRSCNLLIQCFPNILEGLAWISSTAGEGEREREREREREKLQYLVFKMPKERAAVIPSFLDAIIQRWSTNQALFPHNILKNIFS